MKVKAMGTEVAESDVGLLKELSFGADFLVVYSAREQQ